jgi:integrase
MRGDGRVFQRGEKFWIAYYVKKGGKSVEKREPGGITKKAANKKLKHRRKEIGASELGVYTFPGPEAERLTIEDLLGSLAEHYRIEGREQNRSASHMKQLRDFFGCERAVSVMGARVQQYIRHRQAAKRAAAHGTINRELHILRRAFSLAIEHKRLTNMHMPDFTHLPEEENVREGFVEKGDFDAILSHLKDADVRDIVAWAFWTGMRRGEVSKLTWVGFDRETSTLILPGKSAKTRKPRKLILEGIYREIIARRLSARRLDCHLIFHRNGRPMGTFRKAWASACKKAGVPGLLFHDLRRTAVRNMIRAGVDKTVAKKISGHRTDAVFDRYNITSDEDIRDAMQKNETYVSGLSAKSPITTLKQVG